MPSGLQLYPPTLSGCSGCIFLLLILIMPGIVLAYFFQSLVWLFVIPIGTVVALLFLNRVAPKRNMTPEEFADKLERHLLGTEGRWDWDDITSVRVADERLERIRQHLPKFDSLKSEKDREELKALIEAIRRHEFPEVVPEFISYR